MLIQSNSWNDSLQASKLKANRCEMWIWFYISITFLVLSFDLCECIMCAFYSQSVWMRVFTSHTCDLESLQYSWYFKLNSGHHAWSWSWRNFYGLFKINNFFLFHVLHLHSIRAPIESRALSPRPLRCVCKCLRMEQWIMYVTLAEMCRSKREICSKIYNKNRNEAKQHKELSVAITTAGQYQSIELLTE